MRWIAVGLLIASGVVVALLALDRLLLWMERKGWVYWRKTTRRTGPGVGNALLEIQTLVDPGTRHVLEQRLEEREEREDPGDPPEPGQGGSG